MTRNPETADDPGDYAIGISDVMESPFGEGLMVAATGGDRARNPHLVETEAWQEWLRGFQAWEDAPKFTLDIDHD